MYLAMLDKLMGYCEAHQQFEAGIVHGTRILLFDRAREHTHRHLMRLQHLAGNRTAALRQFERCSAALDEELGVKPARSTLALYEQIRDDQVTLTNIPATPFQARDTTAVQLPEVLGSLKELRERLTDGQNAVQHGIQAIELAMKSRQ
jgi:DNA-binding SARP family transcriptional activator